MSGTDIVPSGGPSLPGGGRARRAFSRQRDNNDDLPQDLLEFQSPSAALVALPPRATAQYMIWVVCSMAIVMLIVMGTFPLDRVVTTPGELVSTTATLLVQPLETSIVKSIDVTEGQIVKKGAVLAHLDPTMTQADVTNLREQTTSYEAQIDRLKAEASGADYKPDLNNSYSTGEAAIFLRRASEFKARVLDYTQQIAAQQSELTGAQANAAMYAGRAKLAMDVRNMRVQLQHEQVGSRLSSLSAQDDLMEIERSQIGAQQDAASAQSKVASLNAQQQSFIENWKGQVLSDLSEAEHKYYEAKGDFDKDVLRQGLITMRAGADSVVLTIAKVSVGSVLTPAAQFITLVPLDAPLEVEAKLRGLDSGYVKLGDPALIKFATFPYNQFGGAEASIRTVSADSFSKDDSGTGGAAPPAGDVQSGGTDDLYYRIRLRVNRYTLHGVPNYFHPVPGMPVVADIEIGKRTILQYLLQRLLPVATEGMREP